MPKPNLPLDPEDLPPGPSKDVLAILPVLEKSLPKPPELFLISKPSDAPKTDPGESGFVTVVEWPLRPGDSRIEAYHIGTDKSRKNWVLWQFSMNDLAPFVPKYLEKRPIARLARKKISMRDAAALLIKAVWEYERDMWETPAFMMVSDSGCLDSTATYAIAEMVWGEPEDEEEEEDDEEDDQ
ncbi:MAG: hypothetical protein ACKO2G_12520 [Verrucomicrobiales bacterium]